MSYDLGMKLLHRACQEQEPMKWHRAKLTEVMFIGPEKPIFVWVEEHVKKYHQLPQVETLIAAWPMLAAVAAVEPMKYYLEKVENAFFYRLVNNANIESQTILKANQDNHEKAVSVLKNASKQITQQKYRTRILDLGLEGAKTVMTEYHGVGKPDTTCKFGWDYMDFQSGGIVPGDVISFVGRPAAGKSWMLLYMALHNWQHMMRNVLFVSMEMNPLAIAQRTTAMYSHLPYDQLKKSAFSSGSMSKFISSISSLKNEKAKFFVVDGNLAVGVDEIFDLSDLLECQLIVVDGAYLLRHRDARMDRFTRVAENIREIKRHTSGEVGFSTIASWQFARSAVKGKPKDKKETSEKAGLEDIGMSDEIGQISSIVLAMDQDDSVETMLARKIRVMKGRAGEVGSFAINWGFDTMDFSQYVYPEKQIPMGHI